MPGDLSTIIEIYTDSWDNIFSRADFNNHAHLRLGFAKAWEELVMDADSPDNILYALQLNELVNNKSTLVKLRSLLFPLIVENLDKACFEDKAGVNLPMFGRLLYAEIDSLPSDSEIFTLLAQLTSAQIDKTPLALLNEFVFDFNQKFIFNEENFMRYQAQAETLEYLKEVKMQPFKLHVTLPLESNLLWSRDAAKRIYDLLKQAVADGVLHRAKVVRDFASNERCITIDERFYHYSQFTLYLPDPLNVDELKKLIEQINQIAKEEGVYQSVYEKETDTHISGIVSLRYDYGRGCYTPAHETTTDDLVKQQQLPIVQQLKVEESKNENAAEVFLTNKKILSQFYEEIKKSMSKDSLNGEKGSVFKAIYSRLLCREKLNASELRRDLKILLKIILQPNKSTNTTTTGLAALKLLNMPEYNRLKQVISNDNKKLSAEDISRFAQGDFYDPTFFSPQNKKENIEACDKEVKKLSQKIGIRRIG